jgi:hypothetical protein
VERPARELPGGLRGQDRPHGQRRLVGGRRRPPERRDHLRDPARQPGSGNAQRRSLGSSHLGPRPLSDGPRDRAGANLRDRDGAVRPPSARARRLAARNEDRPHRPVDGRAGSRAVGRFAAGRTGPEARGGEIYAKLLANSPLVASARSPSRAWWAAPAVHKRTFHHIGSWFS